MTSALSMQVRRRVGAVVRLVSLVSSCAAMAGCPMFRIHPPGYLKAPYPQAHLWAVAPLLNESGSSHADGHRLADVLAQQAQDAHGINVIPVNRVILAMRELDMPRITGPADARMIIAALGVDGLIAGTITAYDPYRPMTLGAAVELHLADRALHHRAASDSSPEREIDTRQLVRSPTTSETFAPGDFGGSRRNPVAQAAGIFDASNHRTLAQLRSFSWGRAAPDSAYGRDIYLVSMDMYKQFVSYRLLHDLLESERLRLRAEAVARSKR